MVQRIDKLTIIEELSKYKPFSQEIQTVKGPQKIILFKHTDKRIKANVLRETA